MVAKAKTVVMKPTAKVSKSKPVEDNKKISTTVMMDFEADAGKGLENTDKDSFAIPFLSLLQGLSPQLETVDKAKPGLFINNITNHLYDNPIIIPVSFQRRFLRWVPRSEGGGFKGQYTVAEVERLINDGEVERGDNGVYKLEGDDLRDTRIHFILLLDKEGYSPAIVSLGSTQIKRSKRWLTQIRNLQWDGKKGKYTPPSFATTYKASAEKEKNEKGAWWSWAFNYEGPVNDPEVYRAAKEFHDQSATINVVPPTDEQDTEEF